MKSETPQAFLPEMIREREALGQFGHAAVKSGVEASHLGQFRKAARNSFNSRDL